ncbi:hypothetical protein CL176_04425 [Suicoccus acidiformans]|uniref:O-antigen ligase-related domain-containing protein n=1 Tax=Suicoccus acidiformans TaxID=2036206 RepID=A0A347WJP5_9LACT|nr:O-antigen ligase family protein [Suicoccus acidiformans]AXY25302.1 hypothetical protein CL176_04425 [Suicoccus acidiformans]
MKNNNKFKKINRTSDLYIAIALTISMFLLLFFPQNVYFNLLFIIVVFLLYILFNLPNFKINLNASIFSLLLFIIISIFGLLMGSSPADGANTFILQLCVVFLVQISLTGNIVNFSYIKNGFLFLCILIIIGNIIQIINPEFLITINQMHLHDYFLNSTTQYIREGRLNSFTFNTGVNAFFIMILLFAILNNMLASKKTSRKIIYAFFSLFLLYLLIGTHRRTHLIAFVIVFAISMILHYKFSFKSFFKILFFIGLFIILFLNTEIGQAMIQRILLNNDINDITTGRWPVYKQMWSDFLSKPLLGHGTYTTSQNIYLSFGHNIYLQVLRENGIIGFLAFLSYLIINLYYSTRIFFINTTKRLRKENLLLFQIQLSFIIIGVSENPLYELYTLLTYVIVVSVMYTMISKKNMISSESSLEV